MTGSTPDAQVLVDYVSRALEHIERGESVDLDALCHAHPELAAEVAHALRLAPTVTGWAEGRWRRGPLAGRVLAGRYELQEQIGAGAMGTVYRAHDRELQRRVAVKLLQPHLFGGAAAEARFKREAEVLAALRHPNVVAVFDRGVTDDELRYVVLELLEGASLQAFLEQVAARVASDGWDGTRDARALAPPGMTLPEQSFARLAAAWGADLASGLEAAHRAGIVHRDVKPSNVWIAPEGRARLLDFGIAARAEDPSLTPEGGIGTPAYMAPEQLRPGHSPNPAVDVYSLCATLYHALSGRRPYDGDASRILAALSREAPPPLARVRPGLPKDLVAVIEQGMRRDPTRRYPAAQALLDDLRAFLDHRPVRARYIGPGRRTAARVARSPTVRASTALVAAVALSLAGARYYGKQVEADARAYDSVIAQLPHSLTLGTRPVIEDAGERARITGLLDRALTLAPADLDARMHRAAFRWDHGDRDGAAADARALRDVVGSTYAAALARCYAAPGDAAARPTTDANLPKPQSAADHFLAGFHALRRAEFDRADVHLAAAAEFRGARSLRLAVRLRNAANHTERRSVYRDGLRLEGEYGRPLLRTRYAVGFALLAMQRYAEAVGPLRFVADAEPTSFGCALNLGIALRRSKKFNPAARESLERALRLRPDDERAQRTYAYVLAECGDFLGAARAAQTIVEPSAREEAMGNVHRLRMSCALIDGQWDAARSAAAAAVDCFEAAQEAGVTLDHRRRGWLAQCRALATGDDISARLQLARGLASDPSDLGLRNLAEALRSEQAEDGPLMHALADLLDILRAR
ncbi:MAG: serine/threonine-protein kinase [Planctomycetota bacterium]